MLITNFIHHSCGKYSVSNLGHKLAFKFFLLILIGRLKVSGDMSLFFTDIFLNDLKVGING